MKVAAVIPAYDEEKTIGVVIEALLESPLIEEIIVVSDGSTDKTAEIARSYPIKVLELKENVGKGGAMKAGAKETVCDVLLFIDADLVGLQSNHIETLLNPVLSGRTDMSIGVFSDGRPSTDLAQKIAPSLSGQRAVKRDFFEKIPKLEHSRFGVEVALTRYADQHDIDIVTVALPALSQVLKEEKRGFAQGFWARLKMYWEIIKSIKM